MLANQRCQVVEKHVHARRVAEDLASVQHHKIVAQQIIALLQQAHGQGGLAASTTGREEVCCSLLAQSRGMHKGHALLVGFEANQEINDVSAHE